jgi:predicted MFS family arabinose efflux permease
VLPSLLNFEQVLFAVISSFLLSKYGRKTILQLGTAGAAVSNLVIAVGFWLD